MGGTVPPPTRPPESVGSKITGRLFVGRPPIVVCAIFPFPLRTMITRSAEVAFWTSSKRPHFISAFSTFSCAARFAFGASGVTPAFGSISTSTVLACSTSAGSSTFFLSFAPATAPHIANASEDARILLYRMPTSPNARSRRLAASLVHYCPHVLSQIFSPDRVISAAHGFRQSMGRRIWTSRKTRGCPTIHLTRWVALDRTSTIELPHHR